MFEFVDRNQKSNLVLVPGWAFDCRIFAGLVLPFNYFYYCGRSPGDFGEGLKELLERNSIKTISLLGWSQGAFAVCEFAGRNPQLVEEVILVSVRKRYDSGGLAGIKKYLKKNRSAYLYSFYRDCFCESEKDRYRWFRKRLLKDYLDRMSLERLMEDLDYIEKAQIEAESLRTLKRVTFVHGEEDRIAPIEQARKVADSGLRARFFAFEQTGHLPFLHPDFSKSLYE